MITKKLTTWQTSDEIISEIQTIVSKSNLPLSVVFEGDKLVKVQYDDSTLIAGQKTLISTYLTSKGLT